MAPILVVLVLSLAAGLLLGGSFRNFERLRIHWWALAIGGLALQVVPAPDLPGLSDRGSAAVTLLLSYGLLLAFVTVNRWVPAAGVMAVGLLLNMVVVGANAGMPVSAWAIHEAGGSESALASVSGAKHHLMGDDDVLTPLGDVIPIPPPVGVVLSIGDVLLYAGMAWFLVQVTRGRSRENPRPLAMWFLAYRGKHAPVHWRLPARHRTADPAGAGRPGTGP
jgi:hypothetical protein